MMFLGLENPSPRELTQAKNKYILQLLKDKNVTYTQTQTLLRAISLNDRRHIYYFGEVLSYPNGQPIEGWEMVTPLQLYQMEMNINVD